MQHCFIEGAITSRGIEEKKSGNGNSFYTFAVSLPSGYGKYKRTDYMNCIAYGKTGENINKFFKAHSIIELEGEFQNSPYTKYTAKNGKQYDLPNWQFVVSKMSFPPKPLQVEESEDDVDVFVPVSSEEKAYNEPTTSDADISADFAVVDDDDIPF